MDEMEITAMLPGNLSKLCNLLSASFIVDVMQNFIRIPKSFIHVNGDNFIIHSLVFSLRGRTGRNQSPVL